MLTFELYTGAQRPSAKFNLRAIDPAFSDFDRPREEGLLPLLHEAEQAFVKPIVVKDEVSLFFLTKPTEPENHRVQECFASEALSASDLNPTKMGKPA